MEAFYNYIFRCFNIKLILFLWVAFQFTSNVGVAQDIQFTQFYAAQSYLNPAFAGSIHYNRIGFNQRVQWPNLDAKYLSSMVSFDAYFEKYKSGIGLYALYDYQGFGQMTSKELQFQYAYEIPLSEELTLRPALQLGFVSRSLDDSKLLFPDQYDSQGYTGPADEDFLNETIQFADISSGFVLHSPSFWIGGSLHHMNTPDVTFLSGETSEWPVRLAFVGGYKFMIRDVSQIYADDDISLVPSFHYKSQGKSDQLDLGVYLNYQFLVTGIWYRGIPVKKYAKDLQNNESMAVLAGVRIERWRAAYSYDFVVSRLVPANPVGAHEISITYSFIPQQKRQLKKMPCPEF